MVTRAEVSKDVIALVQHIELNESGWLDTAVARAVKFICWLLDRPLSLEEIYEQRSSAALGVLSRQQIEQALQILQDTGSVIALQGGLYKLSEAERISCENAVSAASKIEDSVRERVLAVAAEHGASTTDETGRALWDRFHSEFVGPFITEFGARAYELITGVTKHEARVQFVSEFLNRFPEGQRGILEPMILALLDANSPECRTYVLRLLNSYFFLSATSLPNGVINRAFLDKNVNHNLKLVLDTNFLFSLFELHSNPSNEAVNLLLGTIKKLSKNINVKMYVLPATILEFRRSLTAYERMASSISRSRGVVSGGLHVGMPGIIQAFLQKVSESGYRLNPESYFQPYHKNIVALLKEHNISVLNGEDDKYATDPSTIDDTTDQLAFYKQRFRNEPRRQKSYEQIWHDMVLWHFVEDRRPTIHDSIFDAGWIAVTVDFGLMAFDRHKRKAHSIPCAVHPASLVQVLQLLIPADEKLERTILALMQMPFLFETFNQDDERITQKILASLSRFEGVNSLSAESVVDLLRDQALRTKIDNAADKNEEIAFIKDALIEHAAEMEARAKAVEAQFLAHKEAGALAAAEAEQRYKEVIEDKQSVEEALLDAKEQALSAERERERLSEQLKIEQERQRNSERLTEQRRQLLGLVFAILVTFAALIAITHLVWKYWEHIAGYGSLYPWAAIITAFVAFVQFSGWRWSKLSPPPQGRSYDIFMGIKRWIGVGYFSCVLAIGESVLVEEWKAQASATGSQAVQQKP